MASSASALAGSEWLPPGMWFYAFMFQSPNHILAEYAEAGKLPVPATLLIGMGVGAVLSVVRFLLDISLFKPLAKSVLGLPPLPKLEPVADLDVLCSKSKAPSPEQVTEASASTGLPAEAVREYARVKREGVLQEQKLSKFKEAAWRLVVYSGLVLFGFNISYGKEWFADPFLVWDSWPTGARSDGLEVYYHCAMGVYWHFIAFQYWETRRSDFLQMLLHHVATLFLLTYSWLMSLARIGTLIMLCHDVSDLFMETAKLFNYAQKRFHWCHLAADGVFFVFAGVFGVSRLFVFPRYLILSVARTSTLNEIQKVFFVGLLCTLLVLHVFWFYLILRMVYMFVFHGVEEDIREGGEDAAETNGHKSNGRQSNGHRHKTVGQAQPLSQQQPNDGKAKKA